MPAKSSLVASGESDFRAGLRFQVQELNGSIGDRNASSEYIPYSGTGSAPEYHSATFTYTVQAGDDSGISAVDINATIYDLAGNANYYSSADSNDSVTNSLLASALYSGIELDGLGATAAIDLASDVQLKVARPGGDLSTPLSTSSAPAPYGVGSTLYFEITYDQNIHTNNLSGAADDIRLVLAPVSASGGSAVAASIIDAQLNSYDGSSGGSITNRRLTFTYALSASDVSDASGYLLQSLDYGASSLARYGILDAYGNGINDSNLSHDFSALNITTGAIDTEMPFIDAVTIVDSSGAVLPSSPGELYGHDDSITFALTLSEPVSLLESDFYDVEQGLSFKIKPSSGDDSYRIASYSGAQSDQQTFTFTYVVGSTSGATDKGALYLDDMTLLGNTYDSALNLESNLSYSGPSTGSADSGHSVDSGAPVVTAISVEYQPSGSSSFDAIQDGTAYTLGIGTTLRFSLTFDEAISFDTSLSAADSPYLELKAVDSAISTPQRIRADLSADTISAMASNGSATSVDFTFVVGQGDSNSSADDNATQQSLYNYLEIFSVQNAEHIQDSAGNGLASSGGYALSADPFELLHPDGVDSEPDALGDTMIAIDSVRPQITLLALDKSSAETYGFSEDLSLTVSFSEALNESALDSATPVSQVAMRLRRTDPDFNDPDRISFAYTFSKQQTTTDDAGTAVAYILTSASQGTVYDASGSGSPAGNFVNFVYEGAITGEYNLTGNIRDLGGNYIDPADLNISTSGSSPSPSSLLRVSPTAFVDHLPPRALGTSVRLSGGGSPSSSALYSLGDVFVFTISFHEDLSLLNHDDNLSHLQLDLDFDDNSSDRSIGLGSIPAGDPSKLYFTYTVSDGDQALSNGATLALHGFSKATGYNTLALVDAHGNSLDPESLDFAYYDLDGNGSVDDAGTIGIVDAGDEEFDILQPDYDLAIDGIRPYWVSISSSSSYTDSSSTPATEVNRSTPYALSSGETIVFTLTASEELSASEVNMQLLLDLQPEASDLSEPQIRAVLGAFAGSTPSAVITFSYTIGDDPADTDGDGIDHLAIMASSSYQFGNIVSQDLAGNQVIENDFSLIDGFSVVPADEYLSSNQVKFDTTPPIVESVEIDGFDSNNLAIKNTLVSFTLHFQDDDLDTVRIDANRSDINLTLLNLSTDLSSSSTTDASIPLDEINSDNLVFSGVLEDNIDWRGVLSLQIADAEALIVDKADSANGMADESIRGSGADDLELTYTIDTAAPRIASANEIDSTVNTAITAAGNGYGPGRQATFLVTFNEELSTIAGSVTSTAKIQFFIYDDDASAGVNARALRLREATASGGSAELSYIEDANGNKRSVARFYYSVNDELDSTSADYDGGSVYLNYADTTTYPSVASAEYARCYDTTTANATDCYIALDAQLKDINNNTSTFTVADDWVYAFNRSDPALDSREPLELTRFVTDPLEIIGYGIRVSPTGANRAWGYDSFSRDNNGSAVAGTAVTALNLDQPYIGASETEDALGNPGSIYFIIEPGAEDFSIDTTPPVDINLSFAIADVQGAEYVATYLDSNNEYITFEFNIGDFQDDYNSTIILQSIAQNAGMSYSDSASGGVYVLADTEFFPSTDLDNSDSAVSQQFDTGLLLDMQKPELLSVVAYREAVAGDGNFSVALTGAANSELYFGRDDQVVFRFSFSEPLGAINTTVGNPSITLPLDLDTGTIVLEQGTPTPDVRSDDTDDFFTFDVTYTVADIHAGRVNNDYFALDAIVSDQNGNTITGDELNISRSISGFVSPEVNGDYPEFSDVNIYRRINLSSADSEVYDPIPDLDNNISAYTLIGGDDLYIAATFTYSLAALADEYPDFQTAGYGNSSGAIEANYSFSNQISGAPSLTADYQATFSDSDRSSDGANVLLFSYAIGANDAADSGANSIRLEDLGGLGDVDKIRDIYGNPTSGYIPDFAEITVTSIDSTAPTLIGVNHVVAAGQVSSKVNYGPLDSNISFALTFDEVIDITESFKTLELTFHIGDNGSYPDRTLRDSTTIAVLEEAAADSASVYAQGQIVNMIYLIDSNDGGSIDVAASSVNSSNITTYYPMRISGNIYDYHNGSSGNSAQISAEVNNSSDINSDFYIPVLSIDQTAISPNRWSVEATTTSGNQIFVPYGSSRADGVVWESNASNISARVGIGNTLSFIVDYPTDIREDSLYADSDTTGSSPANLLDRDNNVTLLFGNSSNSLTYAAPIAEVTNSINPSVNSSSLVFTYQILVDLALELDDIAFASISVPANTTIRSSAFNEIIASGSDFEQGTSVVIDATYPEIAGIEVLGLLSATFPDNAANRRYFGENDNISFRITFSEELIDDDTSDSSPDFGLSWTILDDDDNATMRYFDSSSTSSSAADVSHVLGKTIYDLVYPVELETNSALTLRDYQGLIQFSASSPTTVFTDSSGVIQDRAQNSLASFSYMVAADRNASTSYNYAVDFIRPRLQYIESHSSDTAVSTNSYTEYFGIGGEALTHYYGALDLTFYVVHDSPLGLNSTTVLPELGIKIPTTGGESDFNLSLFGNATSTWPTLSAGGSISDNALAFELDIAAVAPASGASFDGVVSFVEILSATNYSDQPGNYAYFQLVDNGTVQDVYDDGNLSLDGFSSAYYSPTISSVENHAYPMPTIYVDTTAPTFSILNQEKIELTNRALVFELALANALSALELSDVFNTDSNSSYHSAPTYELSWQNGNTRYSYDDLLYDGIGGTDLGNGQIEPFSFTFFSDAGTATSDGSMDTSADYASYLDDLADNSTHTFTMTVTDFVGNSYSETFDVNKTTDEFLGYLTGWDGALNQEYDTVSDDGTIALADNATSATFLVSFITAIDASSLDPADFAISYSSASSADITGLSLAAADIVDNSATAAANDYLLTIAGGNLPLAAGAVTLAFAADQDIRTFDGVTVFDLSLIDDSNESFAYTKDFTFDIDAIAQTNHGDVGAMPELKINFTAPDTGGSSSLTITGYKLYYALNASVIPNTASPYFSSAEHAGAFSPVSNTAQSFVHDCLAILGASNQEYSFRVVAQYTLDGDSNVYESHIDRGGSHSIDLNITLPTYLAGATLDLPYCERANLAGDDAAIISGFGRGLALSRDAAGDPLRNLLASGSIDNSGTAGGAIRHYERSGAEFSLATGSTVDLEFADPIALQFGHNLAVPAVEVSNYDLFIAGNPFATDSSNNNTGSIQLYHKASNSSAWTQSDLSPSNIAAASGAALAIAVNSGNAFALYGEPRYDAGSGSGSGRIVLRKFDSSSVSWQRLGEFDLNGLGSAAVAGDSLFGSAIAVSSAGDTVAVLSTKAVYIYSLSSSGSLSYWHSIAASSFLGAGAAFTADAVDQAQALAIQQTELDDTYLLAIGLPHDSDTTSGIIYGSATNYADTTSGANAGGVLLLTTTSTGALSATSTWRQLAYLRSSAPIADGFYGSNLLFVNPSQPLLLVAEPKLGYGYNAALSQLSIAENSNASDTAKLHIYYLNTDGSNADAQEDLIFSPSSVFSSNSAGYAYAFDYSNNTLALSSPLSAAGEVSLSNLFTSLDLAGSSGAAPQVLSSHALDTSTNATTLSFGVRFPATVDATTIDTSDFTAHITSLGGGSNDLLSSDFSFEPVVGALDYWQVTLNVDSTAVSAGKAGEVHLAFATGAEIKSSTGLAFDLSAFAASSITSNAAASSYTLDYDAPTLASIERYDPSGGQTNQDSVTFRLSFTNELNTSTAQGAGLSTAALDDTLDDYFSVVASTTIGAESATFGVGDLSLSGDTGIDVEANYVAATSTTMDVAIRNIEAIIYNYTNISGDNIFSADGVDFFEISLAIDPSIATVLGDFSGNQLDTSSIANPTSGTKQDTYSVDYKAPTVESFSSSLASGFISADTSITYSISFSETVAALEAQNFQLDIDEADNSVYSGSISFATADQLHEIFGGLGNASSHYGTLSDGSGYEINPPSNASEFSLTLTINEADFADLISEEFSLELLAGGVSDIYGNSMTQQYDEGSNYAINFNQFVLSDQGLTIAENTSGALADGNYTSHLNIFSFFDRADQLSLIGSSNELPSFGFSFSFANPVDPSTVDHDDFDISFGSINLNANPDITISYPDSADGAGNFTTSSETYALGKPDIVFADNDKTIILEYYLSEKMLEYGFDLADDLVIAIKANNTIQSANGGILTEGSQPMAYSIKAAMPLLTQFTRVDGSNSASSADTIIGDYLSFDYDGDGKSGTYYGFQLRYDFNEAIHAVSGKTLATAYSAPDFAYYLSTSDADLLDYSTESLLLDPNANTIPNTTGDYAYFTTSGALLKSSSSSSSSSSSWDHLVYLSADPDDFTEQNSEHNYTLLYDDDYID